MEADTGEVNTKHHPACLANAHQGRYLWVRCGTIHSECSFFYIYNLISSCCANLKNIFKCHRDRPVLRNDHSSQYQNAPLKVSWGNIADADRAR